MPPINTEELLLQELKEANSKLDRLMDMVNKQHTRLSIMESQELDKRLKEVEKLAYKAIGGGMVAGSLASVLIKLFWQ